MSQEEKIGAILNCVQAMQTDVADIKRAVYGDEKIHYRGLLERQATDENDIKDLKEWNKRQRWIVYGGSTVLGFFSPFIYEWIKQLFV